MGKQQTVVRISRKSGLTVRLPPHIKAAARLRPDGRVRLHSPVPSDGAVRPLACASRRMFVRALRKTSEMASTI